MPPCVMHWLCVLAHCIGSLYDGAVTSAIGLNCGNPGPLRKKSRVRARQQQGQVQQGQVQCVPGLGSTSSLLDTLSDTAAHSTNSWRGARRRRELLAGGYLWAAAGRASIKVCTRQLRTSSLAASSAGGPAAWGCGAVPFVSKGAGLGRRQAHQHFGSVPCLPS